MPPSPMPEHAVLANTACSSGCPDCPGGDPPGAAALGAAVARASAASALIYLGWEALDGSAAVAEALARVPAGVMPVLLTHGAGQTSVADLAARLEELRRIRVAQVYYALDPGHYRAAGIERARAVLRVLQGGGTEPKVLFAVPSGYRLPDELLGCEEVSRGCELIAYRGEGLGRPDTAREVLRALPRARRTAAAPRAARAGGAYPLVFHALVLETTYLCNARCSHCYTSCGPDADRRRPSVGDLTRVVDEAAELPNVGKWLHVAGGESTMFWRELLTVLGHAAGRGFNNGITTNGFWAATPERTQRRLAQLAGAGLRRLELSVDAMHQEFIPHGVVTNLLRAVDDHAVQLVLRVTTTRRNTASTALAKVSTVDHGRLHVVAGPAHAAGRAATDIPAEDFWRRSGPRDGSCAEVLNLTVTPDGSVYPCCAGSEACPSLRMGNIYRQSLGDIMASTRSHFLLRTLVHAGPQHFARIVTAAGLGDRLRDGYEDICDLCSHLFSDPELAAAAQRAIDERVGELVRGHREPAVAGVDPTVKPL